MLSSKANPSRVDDIEGIITSIPSLHYANAITISQYDLELMSSLSTQIYKSVALTEKQGGAAVKVITRMKPKLRPYFESNFDSLVENPKWRSPFRVISEKRTISIDTANSEKVIAVEFPYSNEVITDFKGRNGIVHELFKGTFDQTGKRWVFPLTEQNVSYLGLQLLSKGFDADTEFMTYYNEITEIHKSPEAHIPMVTFDNGNYVIKNGHSSIPVLSTTNVAEAMFFAKDYGITTWDDSVSKNFTEITPSVRGMLSSETKQYWVNNDKVPVSEFTDMLQFSGPILFIVPGDNEMQNVCPWVKLAKDIGIDTSNIAVIFRLIQDNARFNQYIKDEGLNNPVNKDTRLVFINNKVRKPLIKSGIRFSTVVNLGYYNYSHFSLQAIVDSSPNFMYYCAKDPGNLQNRRWQRHELS